MITCYIVDDEPLALELMQSYVLKTPFLKLCGSFSSGIQAFAALEKKPVELLFCDIQMPGLSGMELSRMLPEKTRIIFTTAFDQYALEGFRVQALDYLLKPFSYDDFLVSARRAQEWFSLSSAPGNHQVNSLFVKTEYRLQQIMFDQILYVEGMKDYVKIYVEGRRKPVITLITMKSLNSQLPADRFCRVSKSYIVQVSKVNQIEHGRIVFGDTYITVSDSAKDEFQALLSRYSIFP